MEAVIVILPSPFTIIHWDRHWTLKKRKKTDKTGRTGIFSDTSLFLQICQQVQSWMAFMTNFSSTENKHKQAHKFSNQLLSTTTSSTIFVIIVPSYQQLPWHSPLKSSNNAPAVRQHRDVLRQQRPTLRFFERPIIFATASAK